MSATSTRNGKPTDLVEQHKRLVAEYDRTSGAAKAVIAKRIGDAELDMELVGIEYAPWEKPTPYTRSWERSEDELREEITGLRALVEDTSKRDFIRDRASKRLELREEEARKRSITVA